MAPINSKNDPISTSLSNMALQTAQGQIGQCEEPKGSNRGPMVNEYLKSVGLSPGYAWCQAFVYWCYEVAGKKTSKPNPVAKTASVHDCWKQADSKTTTKKLLKEDALKQPELVKPGDQFVLLFGGNTGHTGLVANMEHSGENGKWIVHTIEGNSNNTGGREGYAVVRHERMLDDKNLAGFIQYS